MTKKILIGVGLTLALTVAAIPVLAHMGGWMGGGYGPGAYPFQNEEEFRQAEEARQEFYDQTRQLRQELAVKQQELRALALDPQADEAKINAKQAEVSQLLSRLENEEIKLQRRLAKINPDLGYGNGYGYGRMMGYGYGRGFGPGACW